MDPLRIIPGPLDAHDGHRLLLTLRFGDRVLLRVEHAWSDDFLDWRLTDDVGTSYLELSSIGDDDGSAITFVPGVPEAATWLDLAVEDLTFRVPLDADEPEPRSASFAAAVPGPEPTADLYTMARRGEARRVFVPDRVERDDDVTIVAVLACTDATEVLFHHVGDPRPHPTPALRDDRGTTYTPVAPTHVGSYGMSAGALTGIWRYQPPAPDDVGAFEVDGRSLLR